MTTTPIRLTPCACASVRRASRAISHLYDQVLVPTQLKATQFMILQAISAMGEIAHCDLARDLGASVETLSRRLASARKSGLVQVHSGDRNKRLYSLTPKGQMMLEQATLYWQNAQHRLEHSLGAEDWLLLAEFSDRVAAAAMRAETIRLTNGHTAPQMSGSPQGL